MNKVPRIILIVVISLFALAIIKDFAIKSVVSLVATQVTGAKVSINWMSVGVLRQSVKISGFKMYNPKDFPKGVLVDLPKLTVNYDVASILKGKLHLSLLDINLKEIGLIKNKEGKLNVDSLKVAQQKPAKEEKPAKQMPMQIDVMNLEMGRIVSKDYSVGAEPAISVYDINLKKTYKNITSAQQLAALIISEPMKQAGIRSAGIYGAAMLTGVGFIPIVAITTLTGKDSVAQEFNVAKDKLYDISLGVLKQMGKVNKEDKSGGLIVADVNGVGVTLRLKQVTNRSSQVNISARKFKMPKPEVANGVLYHINEHIK